MKIIRLIRKSTSKSFFSSEPLVCIPFALDYAWPLPEALCPIWIYLDVLFSTASIMHLCAISLDRYVAICNPIQHSRFNSRTKAMLKIAAVWTISIGQSLHSPTAWVMCWLNYRYVWSFSFTLLRLSARCCGICWRNKKQEKVSTTTARKNKITNIKDHHVYEFWHYQA